MLPTMAPGEWFLVDRTARVPARGQLVLLEVPGEKGVLGVRRVIGLPGEHVAFRGGAPAIDDRAATQRPTGQVEMMVDGRPRPLEAREERLGEAPPYTIAHDPGRRSRDLPPVPVPKEAYCVLADNREHGRDSREYGPVPASAIRGTVVRKIVSLWRLERVR
jgi:signal peptidase I